MALKSIKFYSSLWLLDLNYQMKQLILHILQLEIFFLIPLSICHFDTKEVSSNSVDKGEFYFGCNYQGLKLTSSTFFDFLLFLT